jgi:hypothetical protein
MYMSGEPEGVRQYTMSIHDDDVRVWEALWEEVMRVGMDLMRVHAPADSCRKVDQAHLADTVLEQGNLKLSVTRSSPRLETQDQGSRRNTYLACILTDACVVLDILHSQLDATQMPRTTTNSQLSKRCAALFPDLLSS